MCCSFVVPQSGVTPFSWATLNNACAGVHPFAELIDLMVGWRRRVGEPESVQKDLHSESRRQYRPCYQDSLMAVAQHSTYWYWIPCLTQ